MVKIPNPNNVRLKKTILKNMSSTVYVHHIPETEKAVLQYTWFFTVLLYKWRGKSHMYSKVKHLQYGFDILTDLQIRWLKGTFSSASSEHAARRRVAKN